MPKDLEFSGKTFGEFEINNHDSADGYEDIRVAMHARAGCELVRFQNIGVFAVSINGCFVL